MPNAKDNAKLTGDTHLPDIDEGLDDDLPEATPGAAGESRPGKDINQPGFIKDKEGPGKGA